MPKPKILIVEDDPFSVQLLRHNLKRYNAEVLPVATNAADALKIAAKHEPDVALLDIYLDGEQDGLEIAKALHDQYDIPIIYLTGYSSEEVFEHAKQTDPFGYLLKPFTPKELKVTLDMALYKHGITKSLKQQQALLSTTLDALYEAVLTIDADRNITYVNPAANLLLGLEVGEKIDEKINLHLPASNQPVALSGEIFGSKKAPVCKLDLPDSSRWVRVCMSELPKGGEVVVLWDVSSEYETQKTAQTVFKALESITETLLILDPSNDKIIFASSGLEDMAGWPSTEAVGQTPHFLLGPKTHPHFWNDAKLKLRSQSYASYETVIYTKEGKPRLAQWQFSRMKENEQLIICMLRDISDYRKMEEDFRQAQKSEAVGQLAGGIAHDFNNLLSVINSYSDLMMMKLEGESPVLKYAQNIRQAGLRAAELVSKLLTFSRREPTKAQLLDVVDLTNDIHKMLRRVIRENIEINLDCPKDLDVILADRLHLEQILMNLCVNARDAISSEGTIDISWRQENLDFAQAKEKHLKQEGNYLCLEVSDSGCGMDEETIERIFDPYFTTKGEGKGTGLGLSIVMGVIKELRGSLQVDSKPGKGTAFSLYFPSTPRDQMKEKLAEVVTAPEGGNEHVLIVEDDPDVADCLDGVLSDRGYKVKCVNSGQDALDYADNCSESINLLITDIMMPKMSGQDLATQLKDKFSDLKLLFITGYDNPIELLKKFPYAAVVLQKPFSVVSILGKIREILQNPQIDKKLI